MQSNDKIEQLSKELNWPESWPKDVLAQDENGNTPLHHLIRQGYFDKAVTVLDMGADPYIQNKRGFSPLHFWAKAEFKLKNKATQKLLKWFQGHSLDWNCPSQEGLTPIFYAIAYAEMHFTLPIKYLIEMGADLEYRSKEGDTPLLFSASRFNRESIDYAIDNDVIKFLSVLDLGANIHAQNSAGQTALHFMCEPKLVNLLLERGASLDIKDFNGLTPFETHQDNPNILEILFKWKSMREKNNLDEMLESRFDEVKPIRL